MKPKLVLCLALVLSCIGYAVHADELLKTEQQELCALLAKTSPDSVHTNLPNFSRRGGDFSPYLTQPENDRLVKLLRDPEVAIVVTREQVLAAIKQRQLDDSLPGFQFTALMDLVNRRWPHDATVISFYREALATRGEIAIMDLFSPLPGIWDDSLLEPVIEMIEKNASTATTVYKAAAPKQVSWIVIENALSVLDRHYSLWATNTTIPPRLSKSVLTIFPSLTNTSVNPQLKGQMWCNAVWMLSESHDPAMVSVLRPYLEEKDLADDPGGLGDGITTMRICDKAARAINSLLNLKLEFPRSDMLLFGGREVLKNGTNVILWKSHGAAGVNMWSGTDPVWKEWDKKIAELNQILDALPKQ